MSAIKRIVSRINSLSIRTKLIIHASIILIGSYAVLGYQETRMVTRVIEGEALVKAQSDLYTGLEIIDLKYPGPWRAEGGNLYKGETLMNNNFEIVDLIGQLTRGNTATIFLGDTRIATNVLTKDGQRAVGTQAAENVKQKVLIEGQMYLGQAVVVDHTYQTAYMPLKDEAGNIVGMFYVGAPDSGARIQELKRDIAIEIFWQALIILAAALLLNFLFSRPIVKRVEAASVFLSAMAMGDLSGQKIKPGENDEAGKLIRSVNKLQDDLRNIIEQVQVSSEQLASASEELAASADQTSKVTEQISASILEVAEGAQNQMNEVSKANDVVTDISSNMNHAAQLIQNLTDFSHSANVKAQTGTNIVAMAISQMDQVHKAASEATEVIDALGAKSQEIGEIVRVITDIASQTNLLALNAEIEAAHAGEHGRGFAVVADEVRKLSVQSAESASHIEKLIAEVQEEAKKAVASMDQSMKVVQDGMRRVRETGRAFDEITGTITDMIAQFEAIAGIIRQVHEETQKIVRMMEHISSISQQSTANSQNVASAAEEQTAAMEQVAASAAELGRMAEQLQGLIRKFRIH